MASPSCAAAPSASVPSPSSPSPPRPSATGCARPLVSSPTCEPDLLPVTARAVVVYPPRVSNVWRSLLLAVALGVIVSPLPAAAADSAGPKTPIKHLVVIFQENHSFDVYFATYPVALNPPGQPPFRPRPGTPSVNGLTPTLIERNPNSSRPFRIDRTQSYTCDQDHEYR